MRSYANKPKSAVIVTVALYSQARIMRRATYPASPYIPFVPVTGRASNYARQMPNRAWNASINQIGKDVSHVPAGAALLTVRCSVLHPRSTITLDVVDAHREFESSPIISDFFCFAIVLFTPAVVVGVQCIALSASRWGWSLAPVRLRILILNWVIILCFRKAQRAHMTASKPLPKGLISSGWLPFFRRSLRVAIIRRAARHTRHTIIIIIRPNRIKQTRPREAPEGCIKRSAAKWTVLWRGDDVCVCVTPGNMPFSSTLPWVFGFCFESFRTNRK